MIGLIQRVSSASVKVDGAITGEIARGILILLGVEEGDTLAQCEKLADKVVNYRIFPDSEGKMNLSLRDVEGELLVVSQFTLAADTRKGLRPSFTPAASPQQAEKMYNAFTNYCGEQVSKVANGIFGADMHVSLCNYGPVTFLLKT